MIDCLTYMEHNGNTHFWVHDSTIEPLDAYPATVSAKFKKRWEPIVGYLGVELKFKRPGAALPNFLTMDKRLGQNKEIHERRLEILATIYEYGPLDYAGVGGFYTTKGHRPSHHLNDLNVLIALGLVRKDARLIYHTTKAGRDYTEDILT